MSRDHTIRVETKYSESIIEQATISPMGDIVQQVIRLQDEGVRDALVKLGWTPPGPERDALLADRDRLAAELEDLRETVEWLKGVPPEEKVSEELNAAARLDLRRWERFRGPGAVGNRIMHYEDFLAFRAREQGRKESQEEIAELRAELARVRRNHLRRMANTAIRMGSLLRSYDFGGDRAGRRAARYKTFAERCRAALSQDAQTGRPT